jgi:hypothetical protein
MSEKRKIKIRRKKAVLKPQLWLILPLLLCFFLYNFQISEVVISAAEPVEVSISIDTTRDRKSISPYIYGINSDTGSPFVTALAVKQSGTELNTFNWEINAANNGIRDGNLNYELPGGVPAGFPSSFLRNAVAAGIPGRFLTLPISGYAAGDTAGAVMNGETDRFIPIVNRKNAEYMLTPDTTDNYVYTDEYVAYLINNFGWRNAPVQTPDGRVIGGITGYFLGSDPTSVKDNFPMLSLPQLTAQALADSSADAAEVVKMIDPAADVYAPSIRGLENYINLSNNTDWENHSNNYSWYIDFFLDTMKKASEQSSQSARLLDSLDLLFYTEAVTDYGVSVLSSSSAAANTARMEAPRLLWDSTYEEASRSAVTYKAYTPLIPTLQASIRMYNPGTKLSFSEYAFGGGDNISGGIAVADALGIYGKNGIYMAGLVTSETPEYEISGLQIYTNYDGNGGSFQTVSVEAESDDNAPVYAATGSDSDNRLTVLYINKTNTDKNAEFTFVSASDYDNVRIYGFDSLSSAITERTDGDLLVTDNIFEFEIPALSVLMFEFTGSSRPGGVITTAEHPEEFPGAGAQTTAVTDEYGATLTVQTSETTAPVTTAPFFDETQTATTVVAPSSPDKTDDIPIYLKMAGALLLTAVISMMVYIIYRMIRR